MLFLEQSPDPGRLPCPRQFILTSAPEMQRLSQEKGLVLSLLSWSGLLATKAFSSSMYGRAGLRQTENTVEQLQKQSWLSSPNVP